jgi:hypothetical protein
MPSPTGTFYTDWQFWSALVAVAALILTQLPPIRLWFRPRKLEVEVHSRVFINHKIGNPCISMVVGIKNTGGRELTIRSMKLSVHRNEKPLLNLPVQNYYETLSSQSFVLFVPFSLRPGETWTHGSNFLNFFDRETEKKYRESEATLKADIENKLVIRHKDDKNAVIASPELVHPFMELFEQLFTWTPGEYVIDLSVNAEPGTASFNRKYRFTLYESDSAILRSQTQDYKFGVGISYNAEHHVSVVVPLSQHGT